VTLKLAETSVVKSQLSVPYGANCLDLKLIHIMSDNRSWLKHTLFNRE